MIRILPDAVVNKIAAGEVVERPASVVKELLENALDAGSTRIDVILKAGGRSLVRLVDDGEAMGRQDAILSIERHATSKIRNEDDLFAVRTLGFRGEALPSIASVCRFELVTRPRDEEVGTRIRIDAGRLQGVDEVGCAVGTSVEVRSLFYALPVRRKFLRSEATEASHCLEAVTREALIRPDVDFRVRADDKDALVAPRCRDRAARAVALLGEHGRALIPIGFAADGFEVEALVSPIGVHRGDSVGSSFLYVNGRFVRDAVLRRALNEAYRGLVPKGRHPVVVLEVRLAPDRVDVNVHPGKTEVRFRDPWDLERVLAAGLRESLEQSGIRRPPEPILTALPPEDFVLALPLLAREPAAGAPIVEAMLEGLPETEPGEPLLPVGRFRELRVIGQYASTYVLCEGAGELVIVDQHAAHERITLSRLMKDRAARTLGTQRLLTPVVVEVPVARAGAVRESLELLREIGIDCEPFGPGSFAITGVPAVLADADFSALFGDVADEIVEGGVGRAGERLIDDLLATMACHGSVRAAQVLSPTEMRSLLAALDEVDVAVCAHGRPVAIRVGRREIEGRFHRG